MGYNPSGNIKNFSSIHRAAKWAGALGLIQAICWMGLTITGIFAYNCYINSADTLTYGSLIQHTFLNIYFKGDCKPDVFPLYPDANLQGVDRVLSPLQILIWESVYLGVAFFWCLSSILLLTAIKASNRQGTAGVLFIWVFFTLCISIMDLALGIIFGTDYSRYHAKALESNYYIANGEVDYNDTQYLVGAITALSVMFVALKGFVLWLINVSLMVYLGLAAIAMVRDTDGNDTLFMARKDSNDILTTRSPINAYEEAKISSPSYSNEAFVSDDRSMNGVGVDEEALARAARISTYATLQERRFRNINAFQQYPPQRANTTSASGTQGTASTFPAPDYSPPMSRANQDQAQNGVLRTQRY